MIKFIDILNESSEMINCKHCDWKWKRSEGGDDLYVCHKCGHDNHPNSFDTFAEKRMGGAKKIVDNAKEKGGPSLLTYHHFRVKLPYYKKAAEGKFNVESSKKEYKELLEKLYKSTKGDMDIEQVEFQKLVGLIEVIGELLIKHK
jgi:hypothetical protein